MATTDPLYRDPGAARRPGEERARAMAGGVVGGIVGGIAIALALLLLAVSAGGPIWPVFKFAALPFFPMERVGSPAFDPLVIAVGLASHFLVSIAWGVLFALLFFGLSRIATVIAGLFWGIVVWLGMSFVVLPLLGAGAGGGPVVTAILTHLIFGLFLALGFLPFQKRFSGRTRRGQPARVDVTRETPVTP